MQVNLCSVTKIFDYLHKIYQTLCLYVMSYDIFNTCKVSNFLVKKKMKKKVLIVSKKRSEAIFIYLPFFFWCSIQLFPCDLIPRNKITYLDFFFIYNTYNLEGCSFSRSHRGRSYYSYFNPRLALNNIKKIDFQFIII